MTNSFALSFLSTHELPSKIDLLLQTEESLHILRRVLLLGSSTIRVILSGRLDFYGIVDDQLDLGTSSET